MRGCCAVPRGCIGVRQRARGGSTTVTKKWWCRCTVLSELRQFRQKNSEMHNLSCVAPNPLGLVALDYSFKKRNFYLSMTLAILQLGACNIFKTQFGNKWKMGWKHRFLDALVVLHAMMSRWSVEDARENSWRANARCS